MITASGATGRMRYSVGVSANSCDAEIPSLTANVFRSATTVTQRDLISVLRSRLCGAIRHSTIQLGCAISMFAFVRQRTDVLMDVAYRP